MKKVLTIYILTVLFTYVAQSGDFWEYIPTPNDNEIGDIAVAPNGDLYACGLGIYRSTDNGTTWTGINKYTFMGYDVYFDEMDVYFHSITVTKAGTVLAALGNGLAFRSTDEGETWFVLPEIYQNLEKFIVDGNDRIYFTNNNKLYYSDNQGVNWQEYPTSFENDGFIFDIILDENDNLYVSGIAALYVKLKSEDKFESYVIDDGNNSIRRLASKSGLIFATSDKGFLLSSDSGKSWQNMGNVDLNFNVKSLNIDEIGNFYVCTSDNGILYSSDKGLTWNTYAETFTDNRVSCIKFNIDDIYVATNGLYTKTGGAEEWTKISDGMGRPFLEFLGLSDYGNYLIKTNYGLYYSDDGLNSWKMLDRHPVLTGILNNPMVKASIIDYEDNIYISDDSVLFKSTNMGISWDSIAEFSAIVRLWTDDLGNLYLHDYNDGIFISGDYGSSWYHAIDLMIIEFFGFGSEGELVCAGWDSLYISDDLGINWEAIAFPNNEKSQLVRKVIVSGDNIYMAKENEGFIYSTDRGATWDINNDGFDTDLDIDLEMKDIFMLDDKLISCSGYGVYILNDLNGEWELFESGLKRGFNGKFSQVDDGHLYFRSSAGLYKSAGQIMDVVDDKPLISSLLNVYPNPASEYIVLPTVNANISEISIYSLAGVKVYTGKPANKLFIGGLQPGVYMLKAGVNTYRFVKY